MKRKPSELYVEARWRIERGDFDECHPEAKDLVLELLQWFDAADMSSAQRKCLDHAKEVTGSLSCVREGMRKLASRLDADTKDKYLDPVRKDLNVLARHARAVEVVVETDIIAVPWER